VGTAVDLTGGVEIELALGVFMVSVPVHGSILKKMHVKNSRSLPSESVYQIDRIRNTPGQIAIK
jgi:hypothetical protein